ncbi:protein FAM76B [Drosophila obscura]|uniref:protein FAM76B n=1 Tax=Drosophila obscura TaxID=7282 RepID=UPI000B9FCB6F|nr:protein FAM76B [Drosophila obscura]
MDPFVLTLIDNDNLPDDRWYLCTKCFQRFLWVDLSPRQLCCRRCRLPEKNCAICDKSFEPSNREQMYCKRCDYFLMQHAAVKPPPIPKKSELPQTQEEQSTRRVASVTERWREIQCAAGLLDDVNLSD